MPTCSDLNHLQGLQGLLPWLLFGLCYQSVYRGTGPMCDDGTAIWGSGRCYRACHKHEGAPRGVGGCLEWEKEDWPWAGNLKEAKISQFEPGLEASGSLEVPERVSVGGEAGCVVTTA